MPDAGLELYNYAKDNGLLPDMSEDVKKREQLFPEVPDYFIKALKENPKAESNFNSLAVYYYSF